MTLLTVAEILSGETLVSPSGPIDAVTTANSTERPVWDSSDAAQLKAVKVIAHPVASGAQVHREAPVGAGIVL